MARVLAALDRAARYRRSLVNDQRVNPASLVNEITAVPGRLDLHLDREGWAEIGSVVDGLVGCRALAVWWHPDTDRVRVERPPESVPQSPARALYPSRPMGGTDHIPPPFVALPGYIFTYQGNDYTPAEAERLTAEQGSIDGWTWRRDDAAPVSCACLIPSCPVSFRP